MKRTLLVTLALSTIPSFAHAQVTDSPSPAAASPVAPTYAQTPAVAQYRENESLPAVHVQPRTRIYRGGPIPAGATVERPVNRALLLGGVIPLGVLTVINTIWALSACPPGSSSTSCASNTAFLYIPIVGPFFTAASSEASFGGRNLAILDGAIQTVSATLIIASLFTSHRVLVWHDDEVASARPSRREATWSVVPAAAGASVGATLNVTTF